MIITCFIQSFNKLKLLINIIDIQKVDNVVYDNK